MADQHIIQDVTYSELVSLISNSGLNPMLSYRIAEFETVHYMVDGNNSIITIGENNVINHGVIEPLIVTAISTNEISSIAKSELYPYDVIHYDWNPANWMKDASFGGSDGLSLVSGFKGVIYFRHDTINDVSMGYDFRNVKFRRWKLMLDENTPLPSAKFNSPYSATYPGDYIEDSFGGYYSVLDIEDFQDVLTFNCDENSYKNSVFHVNIENVDGKYNTGVYVNTILPNNVFHVGTSTQMVVYDLKIGSYCVLNTFGGYIDSVLAGSYMTNNKISSGFSSITIGSWFERNTFMGAVAYCTIGEDCRANIFDVFDTSTIGNDFNQNIMGVIFKSTFFDGVNNLKLRCPVYNCIIGAVNSYLEAPFVSSEVKFQNNVLNPSVSGTMESKIDFTSATHVYGNYNCELMKTSTGTFKLKYIDGSDNTEKIVAINS